MGGVIYEKKSFCRFTFHAVFLSSTPYTQKDNSSNGAYVLSFEVGDYYTRVRPTLVPRDAYSVRCIKD